MKILVLGSINIDYNYYVGHITTPKETQGASHMEVFPGGKGLNQAVTLARAEFARTWRYSSPVRLDRMDRKCWTSSRSSCALISLRYVW